MNEFYERISNLSPKRLALLALDLQSKLEAAERSRREPIAIVGMSCRFPGADGPEAYWELLRDGVDAVGEIPASRWDSAAHYDPDPEAPGKVATRWGGFVEPIDTFEPQLFGISPREAQTMDPQQRLLLEVSWEALERAGQGPAQLGGSSTGVFVGICNNDYSMQLLNDDVERIDAYLSTGNAHSVASGRLSYVLGLQGPSLSVDTACSSSLVAIHLAVQSLRNGECRMALAGGVNAILSPTTTVTLSRARMMASDGRCKAFDARADGFVRSEGCGIVVLKRLSDAQADGDTVLAVIRGSALNQDGRSNGLTAPNGPSQVAVIRAALEDAGLQPADVHYVETHGTGTSLGDPIEVQALGAALGAGRDSSSRLQIGSVKTNLGHLESAAGVAGLIKAVLMLEHGAIPPHLHLTELNPHIAWDELPINVPTAGVPWPERPGPRIAGVSSFGFSGTNAHVLLEAAPDAAASAPAGREQQLLTLSARTPNALSALAQRFVAHLDAHGELQAADVAFTANSGRTQLPYRLAVVGEGLAQLRDGLAAYVAGEERDELLIGHAEGPRPPAVAFVFTGHGSQYVSMGRKLYDSEPVFRAALDRCDELLRPQLGRSLLEIVEGGQHTNGTGNPLDQMIFAQPAVFALEYALAELWQSWGIRPAAVLGHSVGEYAAAVVAGVMSLEDGVKLVTARGRLMQSLPPDGEMAAIMADEAYVAQLIAPYNGRVTIAAINGPSSIAISGPAAAIDTILSDLAAANIEARRLAVQIAAHSPQVDPILDAFSVVAAQIRYSSPQVDVFSGMTGRLAGEGDLTSADYWRRHLRQPVRFADAASAVYEQGYRAFVEIGPHPTLLGMMRRFLPEDGAAWAPSLRRQQGDARQLLIGLGALATAGVHVDWTAFYGGEQRRHVQLPTYPFERKRYWVDVAPRSAARPRQAAGAHPLLGARVLSPGVQGRAFERYLSVAELPFLSDHHVFDALVVPSPALLEMALAAARASGDVEQYAVEQFIIREALVLPEHGSRVVQTVLGAQADDKPFQIFSREEHGEAWTLHAEGRLVAGTAADAGVLALDAVQAACGERIEGDAYYERLERAGLAFGERFRGLRSIWRRDGEALGLVELPVELAAEAGSYGIHPALLDACLHLLGAPLPDDGRPQAFLLIAIDRFQLYATPGSRLWSHTTLRPGTGAGASFSGDIRLYDEAGRLVAEATGLHLQAASREALLRATRSPLSSWLYEVEWQARPLAGAGAVVLSPRAVAAEVAPLYAPLAQQHGLEQAIALLPELEDLSASYMQRALSRLGWSPVAGDVVSEAALMARLGIVPRYRRLLGRMLAVLAEQGLLLRSGDAWRVVEPPREHDDLAQRADALRARASYGLPELELIERCGEQLADVLRGAADPVQLLFPDGSLALTEPLYGETPFALVGNGMLAEAVRAAVAARPAGQPLRVLEIGAGSGATTRAVLPVLPQGDVEYWFTDVSPHFTARAEAELSGYPFVRTLVFDVERGPGEQGLPLYGFDLVVAANVLHATADLKRTLEHVSEVLAPGGLLLLLEGTRPLRWVDLTFGLTDGWWRFEDTTLRPDHALLSQQGWIELLGAEGFGEAVGLTPESGGQAVLLARAATVTAASSGDQWLVFADAGGVGEALAAELEHAGEKVVVVAAGPVRARIDEARWQTTPDRAGLDHVLAELGPAAGRRRAVFLWGLDQHDEAASGEELLDAQRRGSGGALALAQSLAGQAELWLITRGAQPAGPIVVPAGVGQAALWGLGRVIALEQPELWGGLIDLDPRGGDDVPALLAELRHGDGEDQIALRGAERLVPRLERASPVAAAAPTFRREGSYLITGGLGALGLKLARWLAEHGAGHVVLTGRHGLPERATWPALDPNGRQARQAAAVEAIEALGTTVTIAAVDVADREPMRALFARFGAELPPLRGVFHAAAALGNRAVSELSQVELLAMLRPKLAGGLLLHELSRGHELDAFVLFSSTTALWGSRELAHYAAANQTLDALAHYRRGLGLPALSVNWGTWDEMRVASEAEQQVVAGYGLGRMASEQALAVLGALLEAGATQMAVAAVDWEVLKPAYEARRPRPLLADMAVAPRRAEQAQSHAAAEAGPELLRRIEGVAGDERRALIGDYVREAVARALGISQARQIDDGQGLFELGMDSLMSVELKGRLERSVGQSLPSTLTFNYPSVAALTGFFADELLVEAVAEPVVEAAPVLAVSESVVDELSEDDLAALLAAKLARLN